MKGRNIAVTIVLLKVLCKRQTEKCVKHIGAIHQFCALFVLCKPIEIDV